MFMWVSVTMLCPRCLVTVKSDYNKETTLARCHTGALQHTCSTITRKLPVSATSS